MKKSWENPKLQTLNVGNTNDPVLTSIAPPFPTEDGKEPTRFICKNCWTTFETYQEYNKHMIDTNFHDGTEEDVKYLYS